MPDLENATSAPPLSPRPRRTWDFMETMFVSLIAYGVFTLAAGLTLDVMLATSNGAGPLSPAEMRTQGYWYGLALIIASPLTIAVLWIAIRMARREFAEYLALNWPSRRELVHALATTALFLFVEIVALNLFGANESADYPNDFVSAREAGGLLIFLIGGCIAGPLIEEFVVRGFMFRGWSQSFLGPVGAIVLTSVLWAMIHTQYDWFGRFWVFVSGLMLGHFRWRSNSTWLAVMCHSAINISIFFLLGLYV
jgi:uncharacterized protein